MMKETKEFVVFVAKALNGVGEAMKDGTLTIGDIPAFGEAAAAFPAAISGSSSIKDELISMSDEDLDDLNQTFQKEFDIPEDKAELMVEKVLEVSIAVWKFFN